MNLCDSPKTTFLNESKETRPLPLSTLNSQKVVLEVRGIGHIPAFKNRKRAAIHNRTGEPMIVADSKTKKRMNNLEDAIVCELFSWSATNGSATPSECSKQLRTLLSGLCDDSIREIPCGEWATEYVSKGREGVRIEITQLD